LVVIDEFLTVLLVVV